MIAIPGYFHGKQIITYDETRFSYNLMFSDEFEIKIKKKTKRLKIHLD